MKSATHLLLLLGVLGSSAPAAAQPIRFEAEGLERAERLADALQADLGRPLSLEEGLPLLRVVVTPGGQATLTYLLDEATRRTRTITISADREAAIAELTLVGSNLVRDQTEELITEAAPTPSAPPPPSAATQTGSATSQRALVPPVELPPDHLNLAQAHPLHFGLAGYLGLQVESSASGSNVRPFGSFGFSLSGTLNRMLSVGVTRVMLNLVFSSIEGAIVGVEGTPFVELFGFLDPRVQVYGQLGLALQGRSQTSLSEEFVQVAPLLGGGLRFWAANSFSIGVELAAHVVLTDAYFTMGATLPQFSIPATIGLSAEWHINP